jgi:hypothetical protein
MPSREYASTSPDPTTTAAITEHRISPQTLGFNPGDSFYISVAAVDRNGHESLFAYPEVRCDANSCAIPSYAFDVTAPLPMPPPPPPDNDIDDD